jgi:ribosomal protein S27E
MEVGNMASQRKKERHIEWTCPHCGAKYTAPETAAFSTTCQECGRGFYASGVEVQSKESTKIYEQMRKHRKKEIEADKEHE